MLPCLTGSLPSLSVPPPFSSQVIFTSALTGQRVNKIYDAVNRAVKTHRQRVRTSLLNEVLSDALMWQKPPAVKASQIGRIYYCNQVSDGRGRILLRTSSALSPSGMNLLPSTPTCPALRPPKASAESGRA